jgi:hypothetical protein
LDKEKVINKFFRTSPASGPYPPKYYIEKGYGKDGIYIKEKVTQKNIDDCIKQLKNKYNK